MYKGHEYSQDGRYGNGSYRGYTLYPDIDEDGEITGYWIKKDNEEKILKTVDNLREGFDWINEQLA